MSITTALMRMFGLRYPIIQAPMANAAGGDLAREVARAGGLGMIGTGSRATPAWLEGEWSKLEGAGPVGVGFMTWALDRMAEQRHLLTHALGLKPAAVLLSFGDPRPYIPAIRAAGAKVICQVQTVADAELAASAGADLLVAQGTEAGGHTGQVSTLPLLAAVLRAVADVPVAAAGGIADGRALAGAIAMGACGAMLGTRFVATPESLYHPQAKERILRASETDTELTPVFDLVQGIPWPAQYRGRALVNDFTQRWHGREEALKANLEQARQAYEAARREADFRTLAVYAGQSVGQITAIAPAAELVRQIGEEAITLLRR
jgi:nitronate monooxygenase